MAQVIGSTALTRAYLKRIQGSHDFRVYADVLTMEENLTGTARLLDGQVNINDAEPRRTCSLTLAEPRGALDFSSGSAVSGTALWANRLIRIRHVVTVPGFGEVTTVPFIGVPTAMSRNSGEVQVELSDKSALASNGCPPAKFGKGSYAHAAIIVLLRDRCGEFRFRVPSSTRRLSRDYTAGWDDSTAPWTVACQIARVEFGQQLIYSSDGYVTMRPIPSRAVVDAGYVTQPADTAVDFTAAKNYVQVTGGLVTRTAGRVTATARATSVGEPSAGSTITKSYLARNGVPRYWPLIISEDAYTTPAQTAARAAAEVNANAVQEDVKASVVPLFHLDVDDLVTVHPDDATQTLRFSNGSIPLGVGGGGEGSADMSIGFKTWASKRTTPRVSSRITRTRKVKPLPKRRTSTRKRRRR